MNKKQADEIKNSIMKCKLKLQTIQPHLNGNKPVLNENFNKILIEKAILRDKLIHKEVSFINKIAKKLNGKKELICDYFK
ncbi:MAG: hypothetical protein LUH05_03905 [Candidatus Gastranaerophilales bacterium]|nr:hypothetical protein [Candidatus Gastranaerophilales bacterium]